MKATFEYRRAKLKKEASGKFVAVVPAHGEITIEQRSGAVIREADIRMLSAVVEALDAARA